MDYVSKSVNREYFFLRLMTFFRYFGDCLFYGYFYLFLKSRGLGESQIGLVCSLTPIVALICNPFWNYLSKDANRNRKIMRVITVLEGIFILIFTQCQAIEMLALLTCLVAVVGSPFYNLHDGFCGTFAEAYHKNYAKIRFIGTFAYFCATLLAGLVLHLSKDNYDILLWMSGLIFISVSFWFALVKPIDLSLIKNGSNGKRNYSLVLKNKTFWFYMLTYFLIATISSASDQYTSLYFTEYQGLSSANWSLIFSSMLITEFVVMYIYSYLKKGNDSIAWVIIGMAYLLRLLVFFLDLPLPLVIAFAVLRGVSMGLLLPTNLRCIEKICGIENVTPAYFVLAIGSSIVQSIASFTFGNLISLIGYPNFFGIVALLCFVGNTLNIIYQIKHKFNYPTFSLIK